jgi:dihydrofolate synthase/folylpolyglutamate synthase
MISISDLDLQIEQCLNEWFLGEIFSGDLLQLQNAIKFLNLKCSHPNVITIAGTNGKGETAFWVEKILNKHHRTMLWTSPHLICVKERIKINGERISSQELLHQMLLIKNKLLDFKVSYYEFLFLVFISLMNKYQPEYLILEVGLGGRLDAVNLFDAKLVLIPSISRDHTKILGEKLSQIAMEKWGVVRPDSIVKSNLELKYIDQIYQEHADKLKIDYKNVYDRGLKFNAQNKNLAIKGLESIGIKMIDNFPGENPDQRGRLSGVNYQFYGSHNCDGVRKLVHFLCSKNYTNPINSILVSFSERPEKEILTMLKIIKQLRSKNVKLFLTEFEHPKAMKGLNKYTDNEIDWIEWKKLLDDPSSKEKNIIVFGSYYFIGIVQRYFLIKNSSERITTRS